MDEPIATELKTVFPTHDLGRWTSRGADPLIVFATIESHSISEWRALYVGKDFDNQDALRFLKQRFENNVRTL